MRQQSRYAHICHNSYSCTVRTSFVSGLSSSLGMRLPSYKCAFPYTDVLSLFSSHVLFPVAPVGLLPLTPQCLAFIWSMYMGIGKYLHVYMHIYITDLRSVCHMYSMPQLEPFEQWLWSICEYHYALQPQPLPQPESIKSHSEQL